jgi:hypothetical protein
MFIPNIFSKAGADIGDNISNSLMLDSGASQYLSRTPGVAGNRKTWTYSTWVKRTLKETNLLDYLFYVRGSDTEYTYWRFGWGPPGADLLISGSTTTAGVVVNGVFRDPSAYCHMMMTLDTTQAVASDRLKVWKNGVLQTFASATYPLQNTDYGVNATTAHVIGAQLSVSNYFADMYLASTIFVDGQALTPASFGRVSADTGQWVPKDYTGTYGTNGFKLDFTNGSALGTDSSGNSNNWTVNGGITSANQYTDTPTNNYAVLNALDVSPTESNGIASLYAGNLAVVGGNKFMRSWKIPSIGQWYWEVKLIDAYGGTNFAVHGISSGLSTNVTGAYATTTVGGGIFLDGALNQAYTTWAVNDIVGLAYDATTRGLSVYKNGTQVGTTVTANATDKFVYSFLNGTADTSTVTYNFGARPFAYTPPAGFKALCTANLPSPSILKPALHFDAKTRTGTGAAFNVTGELFKPDFIWSKSRSAATDHVLTNSVCLGSQYLKSNSTAAEITDAQLVTAFNADGFSGGTSAAFNTNAATYIDWMWRASDVAAVANNAGSITSQVSANVAAGFSIVTYTGTGANATVGHGLGVAPKMVILGNRSGGIWPVYHQNQNATPQGGYLELDSTAAYTGATVTWNNTSPNSTVFSIGTAPRSNNTGSLYVAYCFAEIEGYSKIGSYVGNGSTDGPFVHCGFRPRYLLVKKSDVAGTNWHVVDAARDVYNPEILGLQPNLAAAETSPYTIDFTATGFKIRTLDAQHNSAGATYVFIAFAEAPTKYATAR